MMLNQVLLALFAAAQPAQGAGAQNDESKLPVHPDRLNARPLIAPREGDQAGGQNSSSATKLLGSKDVNDQLRKLLGDPQMLAHARHIDEWVGQNMQQLEQMAKQSPLYDDLIVRDPALYNVISLYLLAALAERAQDRAFVTAAMTKRDDPAWTEWYSTYARKFFEELDDQKTPAAIAAELGDVTFKDVLEDRLGSSEEDLLKSGKDLAGISDEDLELVRKLAGTATLSDQKEGKIEIDTEADGLRKHYDEKVRTIKQALDQAIQQAKPGGQGGVTIEMNKQDRIPPEVLPTSAQLSDLNVMREGDRKFHVTALARELAHYASRVAYERAATALGRMAAAATGRPRTAFGILAAHLDRQRIELEQVSTAATPAAAQLRAALAKADADKRTRLEGIREARDRELHARQKSTQPKQFGAFERAGVQLDGQERRDYAPGEHFKGSGGDRALETPMDQRVERHAGSLAASDDPISAAGRRGWGGAGGSGGSGIRLVCKMKDGKFVCEIVIPGQGSIPIGN